MISPAPTENQYRVWLKDFADEADVQNLRIDAVAVHWYDWGNVCTNFTGCDLTMPIAGKTVDMNVTNIFNRFKAWVDAVYQLHQKPIWITEFNAHQLRSDAVHKAFIELALPWLDANPNVERYAYFFGNDAPARNADGSLTLAGQAYNNHVSVNAYSANIYDRRPAFSSELLASWEPSSQLQGGRTVTNFAPTYLFSGMTAPTALTRASGVVLPATTASNGYWGGTDWSTTTAAAGVTANKFLKFSLRANRTASYHSINKFNIRISNSGPIQYQIDYQIDNGTFNTGVTVTGPTATTANFTLGPIDLTGISGLQSVAANTTVTFRITPFDASGTGILLIGSGTADTDADLSVTGSFADNLVALPITLSDFQSKSLKDKVLLTWETQSAVNFSHFELERSTDGKAFNEIAKINASKQTAKAQYNYTDTPNAPTNYYRLKIVDLDGSFAYSKIVSETFDAAKSPLLIYPSLTSNNTIQTTFKSVSEDAQIKIFNVNGQLISTYNLEAGTSSQTIEIAHFTEGVYFLMLQDKGAIQTKKFIKQR